MVFGRVDNNFGKIFKDKFKAETEVDKANTKESNTLRPTLNQGGDNTDKELVINSQPETNNTRASARNKKPLERYGNWISYLAVKQMEQDENKDDLHYEALALQTFVK